MGRHDIFLNRNSKLPKTISPGFKLVNPFNVLPTKISRTFLFVLENEDMVFTFPQENTQVGVFGTVFKIKTSGTVLKM